MTQVFGYTPPKVEDGEQYVRFVAIYDGDTWEFQVRDGAGKINTVKVPTEAIGWLARSHEPAADAAAETRPQNSLWEWDLIQKLLASEGSAVTILGDNPDFGGPNNAIEVCADWTNWQTVRFTGDTALQALKNASQMIGGKVMAEGEMAVSRPSPDTVNPTSDKPVAWRKRYRMKSNGMEFFEIDGCAPGDEPYADEDAEKQDLIEAIPLFTRSPEATGDKSRDEQKPPSNKELIKALIRPIAGIQNRTAQEAFDIMADRVRYALKAGGGQ